VNKTRLGNSDLMITPLGVGAWAMGGPTGPFNWGPQDDKESVAAVHAALDAGINWIDTAPVYGLGHSEEVVARLLAERSEKPYVFTKCGFRWDEQGKIENRLKLDSIREEVEASLRRLRIDVIDLYQMHWPNPDEDLEEGWGTMADLKREGKVRWVGASNCSRSQLERAAQIAPITSLQPPYSIPSPEIEPEVLPYCQKHNVGVIVYAPMKSGLLTGKMTRERISQLPPDDFRPRTLSFKEPRLTRNLNLVDVLRRIGDRYGKIPGEVAIAWTLRHPAVSGAIVGLRSPKQVEGIIGAATFRLNEVEIAEITRFMDENAI